MITALLSSLLSAMLASSGAPQTKVFRCVGAHGETVLSELPCDGRANSPSSAPDVDGFDVNRNWGGGCTSSADELRDRVAAAFDSGNVNTLGALFLWRGYGTRSAYARMRELGRMLKKPLATLDLLGANPWSSDHQGFEALSAQPPVALRISVGNERKDGGYDDYRFKLLDANGCVWLGFEDGY